MDGGGVDSVLVNHSHKCGRWVQFPTVRDTGEGSTGAVCAAR